MSETQLVVVDRNSVNDIVQQVALIQQVMERVMRKGEHYGKIPGCGPKPTLLKPGAQKLCLTFRLVPKYTWTEEKLPDNHVKFVVNCALTHQPTGQFAGEGMGACLSMEKRWIKQAPADVYNTVLKMACKRAYVDATINATAASDIFTQDLEEMSQPEDTSGAKDYESVFTGILAEAYDRPAKDKNGKPVDGFVYFGKVGSVSLWTKDPQLGSDFLAANGCTVEVFYVPTGKSNRLTRFSVKSVPTPVQEEEPDDIP